jgi:hypothetical protein
MSARIDIPSAWFPFASAASIFSICSRFVSTLISAFPVRLGIMPSEFFFFVRRSDVDVSSVLLFCSSNLPYLLLSASLFSLLSEPSQLW